MTGFDTGHHGTSGIASGSLDMRRYRERIEADYRAGLGVGIASVRESVDWRQAARGGDFDFETVRARSECAQALGIRIAWTLCHSGPPDDVDITSLTFVDRFRRFASAAARIIIRAGDEIAPVFTPVNEISFLSWALAETNLFGPQRAELRGAGYALKQQLVRGALAACDAILEIEPRARFLHTDPAAQQRESRASPRTRAAGEFAPPSSRDGEAARDAQYQAWDMLAGRLEPQLGGHPRYLDVVGVHWHGGNQSWRGSPDASGAPPRRLALHRLLAEIHARYRRPIVVGEHSYAGTVRAAWLREFGTELCEALEHGIPVLGACLCRAVERPTWEDPRYWRSRRLWDVLLDAGEEVPRASDSASEQALRDLQARIGPLVAGSHGRYTS
jgi:UDP-galactopyranose mutase